MGLIMCSCAAVVDEPSTEVIVRYGTPYYYSDRTVYHYHGYYYVPDRHRYHRYARPPRGRHRH